MPDQRQPRFRGTGKTPAVTIRGQPRTSKLTRRAAADVQIESPSERQHHVTFPLRCTDQPTLPSERQGMPPRPWHQQIDALITRHQQRRRSGQFNLAQPRRAGRKQSHPRWCGIDGDDGKLTGQA